MGGVVVGIVLGSSNPAIIKAGIFLLLLSFLSINEPLIKTILVSFKFNSSREYLFDLKNVSLDKICKLSDSSISAKLISFELLSTAFLISIIFNNSDFMNLLVTLIGAPESPSSCESSKCASIVLSRSV